MARKAQVFWTTARRATLAKEVANYNKRVARARSKLSPSERLTLPPTAYATELRKIISNQADYNRTIKQLKLATAKTLTPKPGKGVTQYQKSIARFKRNLPFESYTENLKTIANRKQANFAKQAKKASQISAKGLKTLAQKSSKIDVTPTLGRFPSQRDYLIQEIGLKAGDEGNFQRIQDWLNNPGKLNRLTMWRDNYLKTVKGNMESALAINDLTSYQYLIDIYNHVQSLSLAEFALAQLVDGAQLGIGQLIPSPSPNNQRGGILDFANQQGAYQRAAEIWLDYGTS